MIDKLIYLKFCWNRAWGHINVPLSIIEKAMLLAVFLKVYGISSWVAVTVSAVLMSLLVLLVGHLDVKWGVASMETSILNRYNPELQNIMKCVRKKRVKRAFNIYGDTS